MKRRSNNRNGITTTGNFPQRATEKLGGSKDIDGKNKRNYKKAI